MRQGVKYKSKEYFPNTVTIISRDRNPKALTAGCLEPKGPKGKESRAVAGGVG